ncbi:MAG TPA: hypothetical protein VGX27_02980 [Candidatus Dormibacteraeota bacterium]|nr:hypothetical protein [Candidatus Dormibacteraeota bacterium]
MVLTGNRWRWIALFLASAAFVAAGVLTFFVAPGGRLGGVVVFLFFGACATVGLVQFVAGSSLVLSPDGFTVNSLGRQTTRRWQDVESFVVVEPSAFSRIVGIKFATPDGRMPAARKAARSVAGFEGALPDTYGMKAGELAALMNDWRARYGSS